MSFLVGITFLLQIAAVFTVELSWVCLVLLSLDQDRYFFPGIQETEALRSADLATRPISGLDDVLCGLLGYY